VTFNFCALQKSGLASQSTLARGNAVAGKKTQQSDRIALRDRKAARVFSLATGLHWRGEYDQAVLAYSRTLMLDGPNPDFYSNQGVCLRA
jgi:hypothetical protein